MKKIIISFIMGAALATAGSVYGAEIKSLVGQSVTIEGQYPVKVDGVTAEKQAIVFDGTSYLPVRAIGDAIGMDVKFDADLGIELTPKETTTKEAAVVTEVLTITPEDQESINRVEKQIALTNQKILDNRAKIAELEKEKAPIQKQIAETTDSQRLMYLNSDLESIQIKIDTTNEQIKMDEDGVVAQQAYITKIKAKYEGNS